MTPRKSKSENLLIIKCVDSVYFVVDFVLWWILGCELSPKDLLNWCHYELCKQWWNVYVFVDMMLKQKTTQNVIKILRQHKYLSARKLLKEFSHRQLTRYFAPSRGVKYCDVGLFVCLFVCLSTRIFPVQISTNFLRMLLVAMAQLYSDDNTIRYIHHVFT